jgi:hypothetical protein
MSKEFKIQGVRRFLYFCTTFEFNIIFVSEYNAYLQNSLELIKFMYFITFELYMYISMVMFVTKSQYKYNLPCKMKCNYWIKTLRTKLLTLKFVHCVYSVRCTVACQTALRSVGVVSSNLCL